MSMMYLTDRQTLGRTNGRTIIKELRTFERRKSEPDSKKERESKIVEEMVLVRV